MICRPAHDGVGKEMRGWGNMWSSHARCTDSSHAGGLSERIIICISCGLISKFGNLDLEVTDLDGTAVQV